MTLQVQRQSYQPPAIEIYPAPEEEIPGASDESQQVEPGTEAAPLQETPIAPSAPIAAPIVTPSEVVIEPRYARLLSVCRYLDCTHLPLKFFDLWAIHDPVQEEARQLNEGNEMYQHALILNGQGVIKINLQKRTFSVLKQVPGNSDTEEFIKALNLLTEYIKPFNPDMPETWERAEIGILHHSHLVKSEFFWKNPAIKSQIVKLQVKLLNCIGTYFLKVKIEKEKAQEYFNAAVELIDSLNAGEAGGEEAGDGMGGVSIDEYTDLLLDQGFCLLKKLDEGGGQAEAQMCFNKALDCQNNNEHINHFQIARCHLYLSKFFLIQEQTDKATFQAELALQDLDKCELGPDALCLKAKIFLEKARISTKANNPQKALDDLQEALRVLEDKELLLRAEIHHEMGSTYSSLSHRVSPEQAKGHKEDAVKQHNAALQLRLSFFPHHTGSRLIAQSYETLAFAYHMAGKKELCIENMTTALHKFIELLGNDHPTIFRIQQILDGLLENPVPPLQPEGVAAVVDVRHPHIRCCVVS